MIETVELCSGTKSFSKVAESLGYGTFTVDIDASLSLQMQSWISRSRYLTGFGTRYEKQGLSG
jgi:hypothetical protein